MEDIMNNYRNNMPHYDSLPHDYNPMGLNERKYSNDKKLYFTNSSPTMPQMPGGIILSDNVLYQGMIASDELIVRRKKTLVRNLRDYLKYISHDERFVTSVLPLGDGLAVTLIK
jgi:hypothetical protein